MFNGTPIYYLTLKGGNTRKKRGQEEGDQGVIFGDQGVIKRRISRPYWTSSGRYKPHDVDHKLELQLGGAETDTENMWMLESSARSEEHTSELQSRPHLVCRLLLEKKN